MTTGTKARILEVAARLFHQQGFEATSVASILRGAGVNSGSLYHFFPSKEMLLAGVLERHLELLRPTIFDPAESSSSDPIERVFKLVELYRTGLLISGCTRGCPIGNLALEMGDKSPRIRALIEDYFIDWIDGAQKWLEEAGDRLPTDLDRGALARMILAVVEGGVMQARAAGTVQPLDASVAQLRSYLVLLMERAKREMSEMSQWSEPSGETSRNRLEPSRDTLPADGKPSPREEMPAALEPAWRAW